MGDATDNDGAILEALAREIREQAEDDGREQLDVERLLALAPWGRRQTERRFRERFLTSPARYFRDRRTERAERLLRDGEDVLSAAARSGFASPGRLHDALVARRGLTPGEVRRRGAGVAISYGFFDTQIGVVLLAATARGLCALRICQFVGAEEQLADVRADYPAAEIREDAAAVQPYADQLVAFLDARSESFRPRLDLLSGTTFQREVWAELQRTRPGDVFSYTDLAARVGRPDAVRAVAGACAANGIAIAIPCHRAVRRDGSLAGFRWGKDWKRRLLDLEAQMAERERPGDADLFGAAAGIK
jgi:AraC family transcriptional regulator of adaptative response/methylated-DNA-[protein]-cysteine methyltransferase